MTKQASIHYLLWALLLWSLNLAAQLPPNYYEQAKTAQLDKQYAKSNRLARLAIQEENAVQKSKAYLLLAENCSVNLLRLSNKKALHYLDSAIAYHPQNSQAYFWYGRFLQEKDQGAGIPYFEKAYEADPKNKFALLKLVNWYSKVSHEEKTILYAQAGLDALPQNLSEEDQVHKIKFYFHLAEALFYSNELEEAIVALDSVIALDTLDYSYEEVARYIRGASYNDLGDYDNALNDLTFIAEQKKANRDEYLNYHLALCYSNKRHPNLALALNSINQSIQLTKKDKDSDQEDFDLCFALRGEIYLKLNQGAAALSDFLQLKEDEFRNYWIGVAYNKTKKYQEALQYFLKYIEDFPDDVEALKEIANSYHHLGLAEKACEMISLCIDYYSESSIEEAAELQQIILLKKEYCQ